MSLCLFLKIQSAQNNLHSRKSHSRVVHSATFQHYSVFLFLKCSLRSSGGGGDQKNTLQEAAERGAQSCFQKKKVVLIKSWLCEPSLEAVVGEEASGQNAKNTGLGIRTLCFRTQVCHLQVTWPPKPIMCPPAPPGPCLWKYLPCLPQRNPGTATCNTTNSSKCSETSIKTSVSYDHFIIQKFWEETCSILNGRGWFHKGLENSLLLTGDHSRTSTPEKSFIKANFSGK